MNQLTPLGGCICCPSSFPLCNSYICQGFCTDGEDEGRCGSELLSGCKCQPRPDMGFDASRFGRSYIFGGESLPADFLLNSIWNQPNWTGRYQTPEVYQSQPSPPPWEPMPEPLTVEQRRANQRLLLEHAFGGQMEYVPGTPEWFEKDRREGRK